MEEMFKKFCLFLFFWSLFWTFLGVLYVKKAGVKVLFRDNRYTFTLTKEGLVRSVREVAKLVVLEVHREYEVRDTVPALLSGPLRIGGRETVLKFNVVVRLAFDVSRIRDEDVELSFSGDTLIVEATLPEPDVMVEVERWWVVSEEVGIFGTPMRSYETSPLFDHIRKLAKGQMEGEIPAWFSEIRRRMEEVMGNLLSKMTGKTVVFRVKGFRVLPQKVE